MEVKIDEMIKMRWFGCLGMRFDLLIIDFIKSFKRNLMLILKREEVDNIINRVKNCLFRGLK